MDAWGTLLRVWRRSEPTGAVRATRGLMAGLLALGALSAALYALVAFGLRFSSAGRDVAAFLATFGALFLLYGAATVLVRRLGDRGPVLALVLAFAVLFRALLLFAGLPAPRRLGAVASDLGGDAVVYTPFLLYDNDVWRYLWEGHVGAAGVSPYAVPPGRVAELAEGDEEPYARLLADERWWDVLDNVSFHGHTTVYPPAAQWLFRLAYRLAPGSVFLWKLLIAAADLAICWGLVLLLGAVGRPRSEALLWAWNPLVLKELAGSGHVDAWMILPLTFAVYWLASRAEVRAQLAFGLSVLVKIASAPLGLLFLLRTRPRTWPALAAVAALGVLPLAGELREAWSGLAAYGSVWVFNSGPWALARGLARHLGADHPALWAHLVTKAALVAAIALVSWRSTSAPRHIVQSAFFVMALVALLNPAVMPWYLLWALPLAVAAGCGSWVVLTGASLLSYLFYVDGVEQAWWLWLEYGIFAAAVGAELWWWRLRACVPPRATRTPPGA